MAAFIQSIIKNPSRSLKVENKAAGTATTAGYLYDLTAGLLVAATNTSTRDTICGVANETIAVADAKTECLIIEPFDGDVWLVDSTENSDVTHNGQAMIIGANAGTVNNTGTTSAVGVVVQVGTFGETTDKKILVRFIRT